MRKGYSIQHIATTPSGWHVRTVKSGGHLVRVAFPPGRRKKGSGIPVEILHPRNENPVCLKNPAELLLMGANPLSSKDRDLQKQARDRASTIRAARLRNPYDSLSVKEKLAFGRLGLGKAQLQTAADIRRARKKVREVNRFRNAMPNPGEVLESVDSPSAENARELYEEFHDTPSENYSVREEPHMPAGDYSDVGRLEALGLKPQPGGETQQVQELSFATKVQLVCDPEAREGRGQLWLAGEQAMDESELSLFGAEAGSRVKVGQLRHIVYEAVKWHPQVPDDARGKNRPYIHTFGDEGGHAPELWYDRGLERCFIEGGSYSVVGVGIKN